MPITLLSGLAGSGKSSHLLERVNEALSQGRQVLTFACSDSPWLQGRDDIQVYRVLTCRRPGLVCPLHHFVSAEECADIVARTPPGTLLAFEEAQYFGPSVVPHWIEADRRGLDLLVASPSAGQLRRLNGHDCARVHLTVACQRCGNAEAAGYFRLPDREATVSVCEPCRAGMVQVGHQEILERLRALPPSPGEEVVDQPVELAECAGWRVLRPDCRALTGLLGFTMRRAGLAPDGGKLMSYLDVGCGTGYFCHQLRRLRCFSRGVDASEGNIAVARLLDSYLRRDHNAYVHADPHDYLRDTQDGPFDVTSAFAVAPWLDAASPEAPGGPRRAATSLRRLFAATQRLCFVSAGDADPAHAARIARAMLDDGGFTDVRVFEATGHGLASDLFVGEKVDNGRPASALRRVSGGSTIDALLEEVDVLAGRVSRKGKIVDALLARLTATPASAGPPGEPDAPLPPDVAKELKELQEQVEAEKKAADYRVLVSRVRQAARAVVPEGATVAVVSRGDEELVKLEGRTGWHFPQNDAGVYSGSYPADSDAAVAHLQSLREKGAAYLLIPSAALWWLDHYHGLRRHLDEHGELALRAEDCLVYTLTSSTTAGPRGQVARDPFAPRSPPGEVR